MAITNYERWKSYTSGLPSPDNYLDWSWYYTVTAALQRRVWLGPAHQPCYPNMYVILVGPPGLGKGLSIKAVTSMLKHWTLDTSKGNEKLATSPEKAAVVEAAVSENLKNASATEQQGTGKGPKDLIKPLLIPVCADAITYEALVQAVAQSYRYINYVEEVNGQPKLRAYGHSSLCFVLEELSSLMRKRTNDTVNYLLGLYDCPVDYEYSTITRGKDRIRRGCLNLIAGTTPAFMQSTFDEDLIGEGFTSRTFYVYSNKNRFYQMWLPPLTPEQEQHKTDLLTHVKKLTSLYGPARISDATRQWMQEWWEKYNEKKEWKNKSPEMIPYYARKNIHVMKLAMALHFGEDAEADEQGRPKNEIPQGTFERAIAVLEAEEKNMHLALVMEGKSPEAKASQKILELLHDGEKQVVDLMIPCHKQGVNRQQFEEALEVLMVTNQIITDSRPDKDTGVETIYYRKT